MKPVASKNIDFISHSGMDGRGDGVQIMVHRGHAYVGHGFSNGVSVLDVQDLKQPKVVNFIPCPANTRAIHLQTHEDLLFAVNGPSVWTMQMTAQDYYAGRAADHLKGGEATYTSGLRIYDISKPATPREIGFLPIDGVGPHRIWYVGGRYAYVSIHFEDFSDNIFAIVDVSDPTNPEIVGRWWIPGMWIGGGEKPSWPEGKRFALHHALVDGNIAYGAWRDGGLTVLDIADPTAPKLLKHLNMDPPFGGGTHSPLPLSDRGLLVLADEATSANCQDGRRYIWMLDVRAPENPISIAAFPEPSEGDYCAKGGNFGPHNLHENRPGSFQSQELIFATYQNAGVRVYDTKDPFRPREIAYYVPPDPTTMMDPRPDRPQVIQSADCYVNPEGVIFLTDPNAGLNILQFTG
ncbi:MAG: hypothetical protein HOL85_17915 [Rhodospirillaceae bacterium]|nr:hypothetical protein [Rhodospirillaceae bacterium]MBT6135972.1 hypothetical protein [Rhodospirillaceae bacterium]